MRDDLSRPACAATTGSCIDLPCPECGPQRRSADNRVRKVLRVWALGDGKYSYACARCGLKGVTSDPYMFDGPVGEGERTHAHDRSYVARKFWRRSAPISGTAAETYLRARACRGSPPPTLRYLSASPGYVHAMIGAFGICAETAPGELAVPRDPPAVHLTRLSPDGRSRIDKRMLGPVSGHPIVLAPVNDGLGLVICEGIEDALSLHEATGLGAWAAGSAVHLGKLGPVVPGFIECVTLAEDADEAGRRACSLLAEGLTARGFEVRILSFAGPPT